MLLLMGRPPRRLIRGISPARWGNCIGHALFKVLLIAPPRRDGGARLESSERGSVRVRVAGRGGRGRGGSKMGNLAHAEHYLFPQFSRNPFLSPLHFPCERKQLPLPPPLLLEHRPRCLSLLLLFHHCLHALRYTLTLQLRGTRPNERKGELHVGPSGVRFEEETREMVGNRSNGKHRDERSL